MRINLTLTILLVLFLSACDEIDKFTQFEMSYHTSMVIPASTGLNLPFNFQSPDIETKAESTFEVNNTRKDLIEEVLLKKLSLSLTEPEQGDLGFLKSIKIYLSAEGEDKILLAWKDPVDPNAGKLIELETSSANLAAYIKMDAFSLSYTTVTDEVINSDHHIDIDAVFNIDAKILGQ
jgi:hypothetical protein